MEGISNILSTGSPIEMLIVLGLFLAWIQGIILAFKANGLLSVIAICFPIIGVIFGLAKWVFREDLPAILNERMFGGE